MKKRLLITSIVMMLVVAVALSTATYAWFTSNTSVTASSVTLTASTSDAEALGIGWVAGEAGTSITISADDTLKPMAPGSLVAGENATTCDVIFRNATVKQEASQFVFNNDVKESYVQINDAGAKAQEGKQYYEKDLDGLYSVKTGLTVNESSVDGLYTKNFAPIVFKNASGTQEFFVRNLSNANTIGKVTVTASFTTNYIYVRTEDVTFQNGKKYYTNTAAANATPVYEEAEVTAGDPIPTGDQATVYYEGLCGNDLVRVAIFTKAPSQGTSTASGYRLIGVLGENRTGWIEVTSGTFDKNVTYYTRSGEENSYTYTQDTTIDEEAFDASLQPNADHLFTATNTAVYGDAGKFDQNDAVKDLNQYINVSTSLTVCTELEPNWEVDIVAIAWLDGTQLDDTKASLIGQVSLQFNASAN